MRGWILDLYEDETDGVRIWLIADDGCRVMLRQKMPVCFYAYGSRPLLHACCLYLKNVAGVLKLSREIKKDVFQKEPLCLLRIDVDNPVRQQMIFRDLKTRFPDVVWYDADVPIQVRHAARWKTFPMALCDVDYDAQSAEIYSLEVLNSRWDLQPLLPVLQTARLVPNCDPNKNEPSSVDFICGKIKQRIPLDDPEEVLTRLNKLTADFDPDLLFTEWGDNWLFPKLIEMESECTVPLLLNRDHDRSLRWKKETSYFSYGQIIYCAQEAHLFGRCHIDTHNAMMWRDYKLEGTLETARVTAMPIEQASRVSPGSGISAMQMITALEQNVLIPEQKQQAESPKTGLELIQYDRGGLIYQPLTGLYSDIAEIDFVSMYPAIIINGNISPEVPLPNGLTPARRELGIVPLTLKPLYEKRVQMKEKLLHFPDKGVPEAQNYKARSSALKWLLVVCFGFLGYKNARFGRIESHEAVTRGGREALLAAKETAEEMGFEVLHMFVDALWLRKRGCRSVTDFQPVLDEISRRTHMMIALDGIYNWVAFLPARGNVNVPVPNRYFGVFRDGSLKMRGIEARRKDMPAWIVEVQQKALKALGEAAVPNELPECLQNAFNIFLRALGDLNHDRVSPERLVITLRISKEIETYKNPTPSVRAARQLFELTGKKTAPGQKVRFLYTKDDIRVRAWELPEPVTPDMIDKEKYRELFGKAVGTILFPFGINAEQAEAWAQGKLQLRIC